MDAIDHINVDVNDLDACYPFYRKVLELDLLRPPSDFQGEHAMFEAGETVLTLAETGRADEWGEENITHPLDKAHIAFETDRENYDRMISELDGQFPKQGPYDWDSFEGFYFLDPDGNLLEIITYEPIPDDTERTLLTHDDV
ncbi:VOC family protein [Natrinema sp. SYSU A 869]|uniref:VOC family protein n=1 Tax=Natrinema sp. SYSU A 869 TaxID=2871694 RepID=UPI001CA4485C|nr:VOC family protein [Natrinema sp. SYSU A 869]